MPDYEQRTWAWAQAHDFWPTVTTNVKNLRNNLKVGKAFRVQFDHWERESASLSPVVSTPPKDKTADVTNIEARQQAIDNCVYCDESGIISIKYLDGNKIQTGAIPNCNHKSDCVERLVRDKKVIEITSATKAHRFDFVEGSVEPRNLELTSGIIRKPMRSWFI